MRFYHCGAERTWKQWQWRDVQHSPKLQHHWSLIIKSFSVISGHSLGGGSCPSAEVQSVYSKAPADWATICLWTTLYIYIYIYIYIKKTHEKSTSNTKYPNSIFQSPTWTQIEPELETRWSDLRYSSNDITNKIYKDTIKKIYSTSS